MRHEIIKATENDSAITLNYGIQKENSNKDCYFGIPVKQKQYPSCYRYNVLIMLAKRLLKEEEQKSNREMLNDKLVKRVISFNITQ